MAATALAAELPSADCVSLNDSSGCFSQNVTFAMVDEKGLHVTGEPPRYWRDRNGALGSMEILGLQAEAYARTKDKTLPLNGRLDRKTLFLRYDELQARYETTRPFLRASPLQADLGAKLAAYRAALAAIKVHEAQYFEPLGKVEIGGQTIYEPPAYGDRKGHFYPEEVHPEDVSLPIARELARLETAILGPLAEAEKTARRLKSECRYGYFRRLRLPDRDYGYDLPAPALSVCLETSALRVGQTPRVSVELVNWLDKPLTIVDDSLRDPVALVRDSYEHDGLELIVEEPGGDWLGRDMLDEKKPLPKPTTRVTLAPEEYRDIPNTGTIALKGLEPRCPGVHKVRPFIEDCWQRVEGGLCDNRGGKLEIEFEATGRPLNGKSCPSVPAARAVGAALEAWLAGYPG